MTLKNATVREVIEAVKTQSGYSFWYRESEIDLRKRVSVEAHDQNVKILLDGLLADQGILVILDCRYIVLYKFDPAGRGREYQLKGRVETEAGDPIVGANVLVEGTTNGMVTNSKGEFALNVTAGARLSVSFIGYDAAQVEVGNRTQLTVVLKENNQLLDDVVVIGYGVLKKVMEESGEVALAAKDVEGWATSSLAAAVALEATEAGGTTTGAETADGGADFPLSVQLPPEYGEAVDHLRYEAAEGVYHLLVVLERYGITLDEFAAELNNRMTEGERPHGAVRLHDEFVRRGK